MIDKNIKTDKKKLVNQKRTLFQNNNIKMGKMKKDIIKDLSLNRNPDIRPNAINSFQRDSIHYVKDRNSFTPSRITSKKFVQEINEEIEYINLNKNKISNLSSFNGFRGKKLPKLNPLKLSKTHKQVIKIDDFLILESDLNNKFFNNNFNRDQLKDFNRRLFEELKKMNYFHEENPQVQVASINKKLMNKKTYKTYDKVLGDKFSNNFYTNIIVKQKPNDKTNNEICQTIESTLANDQNNSFNNSPKKHKKNTYLTAFDTLDNLNSIDLSDNEIFNNVNKNIQSKLDKLNKKIHIDVNHSNSSIDNTIKNNSLININSRASSYHSRAINDMNYHHQDSRSLSVKKTEKSILDNYIRLPKILVSKMNLNDSQNNNKNFNLDFKHNVFYSKDILNRFNKTKKQRYKLDSLVSKISHKIGNGFPLKNYVADYNTYFNIYPKKELNNSQYFTDKLVSDSPKNVYMFNRFKNNNKFM